MIFQKNIYEECSQLLRLRRKGKRKKEKKKLKVGRELFVFTLISLSFTLSSPYLESRINAREQIIFPFVLYLSISL